MDISCWTETEKIHYHNLKRNINCLAGIIYYWEGGNQFKADEWIFNYWINCFRIGIKDSKPLFQVPSWDVSEKLFYQIRES
jgi:hypothetical protein